MRVPGEGVWGRRVQGYARSHLANALRVAGAHPAADAEFERAVELSSKIAAVGESSVRDLQTRPDYAVTVQDALVGPSREV